MAEAASGSSSGPPDPDRPRPITQLHGSVAGLRRPPGPDPMAPVRTATEIAREVTPAQTAAYRPARPQHVQVVAPDGDPVPGLLVEWRRPAGRGWEARVVHAERLGDRWVTCSGWLPAEQVRPV